MHASCQARKRRRQNAASAIRQLPSSADCPETAERLPGDYSGGRFTSPRPCSPMAACGMTDNAIARCIGANELPNTLRRHFRNELDTSLTQVNALVSSQVIAAIRRGEVRACCFWLKGQARWKERQGIEHSGPDVRRCKARSLTFSRRWRMPKRASSDDRQSRPG